MDTFFEQMLDVANDAVFIVELDDNGMPKCFIDLNCKACALLGYSKQELLSMKPTGILAFEIRKDEIKKHYTDLFVNKKYIFEIIYRTKNNGYIPVEVSAHAFKMNGKNVCISISRDISQRKADQEKIINYSRLLEGVLQGISDIIGVYKPDRSIVFYNQAGYDFFGKNPDEINGMKCYEMLNRNKKCQQCPLESITKSRQRVRMEKYIKQFDKYLDCCYNPVLDESGEVIFIVEKLTDITEKRNLENMLKESEESYRQIVDLCPDCIVITVDGKIALANDEALKYEKNLMGQSINKFSPDTSVIMEKRINQILKNKKRKTLFDYKFYVNGNNEIDMEVSSSYLSYRGKPAVLSVLRDITQRKRELNAAAKMQQEIIKKTFPIPDKAVMETLYIPAKTVSGDFYTMHKVNEHLVIGVIADVSGKGITAALSLSAFNVLFHEAVLASNDPHEIINILNRKVGNYLEERYIAACCFSLDFVKKEAKAVGAGINQFIFSNSKQKHKKITIKGSFLGMFEDSIFDEQCILFESGDRFYFFTDGLDFIFFDDKTMQNCLHMCAIEEVKDHLCFSLKDILTDIDGLKDDCTLLAIQIK